MSGDGVLKTRNTEWIGKPWRACTGYFCDSARSGARYEAGAGSTAIGQATDMSLDVAPPQDWPDCCELCSTTTACVAWTYSRSAGLCELFSAVDDDGPTVGVESSWVSGVRGEEQAVIGCYTRDGTGLCANDFLGFFIPALILTFLCGLQGCAFGYSMRVKRRYLDEPRTTFGARLVEQRVESVRYTASGKDGKASEGTAKETHVFVCVARKDTAAADAAADVAGGGGTRTLVVSTTSKQGRATYAANEGSADAAADMHVFADLNNVISESAGPGADPVDGLTSEQHKAKARDAVLVTYPAEVENHCRVVTVLLAFPVVMHLALWGQSMFVPSFLFLGEHTLGEGVFVAAVVLFCLLLVLAAAYLGLGLCHPRYKHMLSSTGVYTGPDRPGVTHGGWSAANEDDARAVRRMLEERRRARNLVRMFTPGAEALLCPGDSVVCHLAFSHPMSPGTLLRGYVIKVDGWNDDVRSFAAGEAPRMPGPGTRVTVRMHSQGDTVVKQVQASAVALAGQPLPPHQLNAWRSNLHASMASKPDHWAKDDILKQCEGGNYLTWLPDIPETSMAVPMPHAVPVAVVPSTGGAAAPAAPAAASP